MNKFHTIKSIEFEDNTLILEIDNKTHKFDLTKCSSKLLNASKTQRDNYEISSSGYGIHWPIIDEDLSIDGLLGIKHTIPSGKRAS